MTLTLGLVAAYRMTRQRLAHKGFSRSPAHCLKMARADLARAGHDRFTYYPQAGLASYQNKPNDRGGRWIERPDLAGLRFVGFADKLARIDHAGWFTSPNGDNGMVYRAAVYQLPARGGRPLYVEGYVSGESRPGGGFQASPNESCEAAVVFLNCVHYGREGGAEGADDYANSAIVADAARGADREAEIAAERDRDYEESWRLGQQAAQAVEDAGRIREVVRRNLAELREVRGLADAPSICSTLRRCIAADLTTARELYEKAAKLWRDNAGVEAFAEGAGAASYWESRK